MIARQGRDQRRPPVDADPAVPAESTKPDNSPFPIG
jgi:hypothetical protein